MSTNKNTLKIKKEKKIPVTIEDIEFIIYPERSKVVEVIGEFANIIKEEDMLDKITEMENKLDMEEADIEEISDICNDALRTLDSFYKIVYGLLGKEIEELIGPADNYNYQNVLEITMFLSEILQDYLQ